MKNKIKEIQNLLLILNKRYKLFTIIGLFLITSSYIYIFERNKFETKSEIIIRSSNSKDFNIDIQSFLTSSGGSKTEDGRYLEIYLESLEAMQKYDRDYPLIKNYKKEGIDFFNGLTSNSNREDKLKFYKNLVQINLDPDYGVLEVKTYGYNPEQSYNLNLFLLERSKSFINKINQDINKQQLEFARKEAFFAKKRVTDASEKLQNYQANNKLISITSEIETSSNILSNLENELVNKKVELSNNLTRYSNNNVPEIVYLQEQIRELEKIIFSERENIVSPKGRELNKKAAKLDELISELDFATDLYKTILTSIESSRINSVQDQRFLTVLSKPYLAEKPFMKWKHMAILSVALTVLIFFSLIKFILMIIENHTDNE